MGFWSNLIGTTESIFKIGKNKASLDASGLTASRTFVLPDTAGTLALTSQLGGSAYTVTTVTGATHNESGTSGTIILLCDCTSNSIMVNLPTAVGNTATIIVKRIDAVIANSLTIDGSSSETIDGGTTALIVKQYTTLGLVSNNTNWFII